MRSFPFAEALYRRQQSSAAADKFSSCFAWRPASVFRYLRMYLARLSRQITQDSTGMTSPLTTRDSGVKKRLQVEVEQIGMWEAYHTTRPSAAHAFWFSGTNWLYCEAIRWHESSGGGAVR